MQNLSAIQAQAKSYNAQAVAMLSRLIEAGAHQGGTSGLEGKRAEILESELKKITDKVLRDAFGNVIGMIGNTMPSLTIWFIGHIDTVGKGEWDKAFVARCEGNKLYGRGSSDQLAGVVSSVLALSALKAQEKYLCEKGVRVVVMGNPHEEDCEGESLKFLLELVQTSAAPFWLQGMPDVILSTEPTANEAGMPRPYFGHRGRYLYNLTVQGQTGHGSVPLKIGAAEVFAKVVAAIFDDVRGPASRKFGQDTFAFTTGKLTSPSQNAHTEVAAWDIDLRIAPTSNPDTILTQMQNTALAVREKLAAQKKLPLAQIPQLELSLVSTRYTTYNNFVFNGVQDLPGPWLRPDHPLRQLALAVYRDLFAGEPPYDKREVKTTEKESKAASEEGDCTIRDFYNFSTDLTALAQLQCKAHKEGKEIPKIAYLGLGSGIEEQAHRKEEYCPLNSLDNATAYYIALVMRLTEEQSKIR
jgi:acetylornithine deacetylase/succinyl-diaminopimelate desuccinylase-like protein